MTLLRCSILSCAAALALLAYGCATTTTPLPLQTQPPPPQAATPAFATNDPPAWFIEPPRDSEALVAAGSAALVLSNPREAALADARRQIAEQMVVEIDSQTKSTTSEIGHRAQRHFEQSICAHTRLLLSDVELVAEDQDGERVFVLLRLARTAAESLLGAERQRSDRILRDVWHAGQSARNGAGAAAAIAAYARGLRESAQRLTRAGVELTPGTTPVDPATVFETALREVVAGIAIKIAPPVRRIAPGADLAARFRVHATDRAGRPLSSLPLRVSLTGGSGSIDRTEVHTDDRGTALLRITALDPAPNPHALRVALDLDRLLGPPSVEPPDGCLRPDGIESIRAHLPLPAAQATLDTRDLHAAIVCANPTAAGLRTSVAEALTERGYRIVPTPAAAERVLRIAARARPADGGALPFCFCALTLRWEDALTGEVVAQAASSGEHRGPLGGSCETACADALAYPLAALLQRLEP